ncbi:phage holin family protein [Kitasatospora indigofera]|uniref:phage holin family protein n=1 Tax=Kitasatospora indigofera TaxID=67307 RepID=UPI00365AADCF
MGLRQRVDRCPPQAGQLTSTARKRLKDVQFRPAQTLQTLKEDAAWARHPTS